MGHGLEESQMVLGTLRRLNAGRAQLREQTGDLHAVGQAQPVHEIPILHDARPPDRFHPGAEGQDAGEIVAATEERLKPERAGFGLEFLEKTTLADPCPARDDDEAAAAAHGVLRGGPKALELGVAAHERDVAALPGWWLPPGTASRRPPRMSADQRPRRQGLPETRRLWLRRDAELSPEQVGAEVILTEGGRAPPQAIVEPHQRPMDRLLEWIDREEPDRGLDGRLELTPRALRGQKSLEHAEGGLAKPIALRSQPLLERRLAERHPCEQLAPIEASRPLEGSTRPLGREALEGPHIHLHAARVQPNAVTLDDHRRRLPVR